MANDLRISLSEDGADDERLDLLTSRLSDELRQLDDVEVARATTPALPGTRSVDAMQVAELAVTLAGSGVLSQVVDVLRRWLHRSHQSASAQTVRLELDGDVLELSGASAQDQERLVQLFLLRHVRKPGTT
ncbi:MAG TPA: hypothetical protein VFJ97_05460 [Dermatophilaceae bacterium]|nr:hypothetical protein [Dermatophilaceae bacterium]